MRFYRDDICDTFVVYPQVRISSPDKMNPMENVEYGNVYLDRIKNPEYRDVYLDVLVHAVTGVSRRVPPVSRTMGAGSGLIGFPHYSVRGMPRTEAEQAGRRLTAPTARQPLHDSAIAHRSHMSFNEARPFLYF